MKVAATLKIRGGVDIDSGGKRAGKGPLVQWEKSGTLGVSQDQTLFVWETKNELCGAERQTETMAEESLLPFLATTVFDESQITCKDNYSRPRWGDPCHPLTQNCNRSEVIIQRGKGV